MFTNLNNDGIIQNLKAGAKLYIIEFYPNIDQTGNIYLPVDQDNRYLAPIEPSLNVGNIRGNVIATRLQKSPVVLSEKEFEAAFTLYYNSIITECNKYGFNPNIAHIGVERMYQMYKYTLETDTCAGVVNITEVMNNNDYIAINADDKGKINTLKVIPELMYVPVGYRTFVYALARMFPEMSNAMTLGGSLLAYDNYTKLFNVNNETRYVNYNVLDAQNLNQVITVIGNMTNGVNEQIIRSALNENVDKPELYNYMNYMMNNGIGATTAISMLSYHPNVLEVIFKAVRGSLNLDIKDVVSIPVILFVPSNRQSFIESTTLY